MVKAQIFMSACVSACEFHDQSRHYSTLSVSSMSNITFHPGSRHRVPFTMCADSVCPYRFRHTRRAHCPHTSARGDNLVDRVERKREGQFNRGTITNHITHGPLVTSQPLLAPWSSICCICINLSIDWMATTFVLVLTRI
jgi:hypothetical protein